MQQKINDTPLHWKRRWPSVSIVVYHLYTFVMIVPNVGLVYINVREYQRAIQKFTIQRNWQHSEHKKNTNKYVTLLW
jgi:hypothetical protein